LGTSTVASIVRTVANLDPVRAWVKEGAPGVFVIDANSEAGWHAEHFQ
jgi:hypothetical protein